MNRIKELRLKNGFKSQRDLAAVLFVNQTAVSQWERGATLPSSQMLLRLSDLFGVSAEYLLGVDSENKNPPVVADEGLNPGYYELTPENKALVDSMIEKLIKSQSDG